MKRMSWKRGLKVGLLVAVSGLAVAGASAFAEGHMGHEGFFKKMVAERVDGALNAARATQEQRNQVDAIRDKVMAQMMAGHEGQGAQRMEEGLALFEADKIDAEKLKALRATHEAEQQAHGDQLVQAVEETHGLFDAGQRKAIVDYLKESRPGFMGGAGKLGENMMKKMAQSRINDALAAAKATDAQRTQVEAASEHVFAAFESTHGDVGKDMDRVLDLFAADKIDPAAVTALRTEHQARAQKLGDAIVQALYDVHDAFTPVQRKAIGNFVREEAQKHHAHGPGRGHEPGTEKDK